MSCLGIAAAAFAVVGLWLATDNFAVDTVGDEGYPCYAPYDIVLNDVTVKGVPDDLHAVQVACRDGAEARFKLAIGSGAAAAFAAIAGLTVWRSSRRLRLPGPRMRM
jgi:hypothetical protein